MPENAAEITRLLNSAGENPENINRALPLVYEELRLLASGQLRRERNGHTLNTTSLVHESYLKLVKHPPEGQWEGRRHFFGTAARAMRQVLVNYALKRSRKKRGGYLQIEPYEEGIFLSEQKSEELIALDSALKELEQMNERQCRVVECRYFAGYNIDETAEILEISKATVKRDWLSARAWLFTRMQEEG